ncbi:YfhO family protein [Flavobacterium sp. TAB 87]|uniref:YfhO family protein n=1 Tax=Flavobacterium sp. TAB 87 TaxID=1729581 RepID=UPI00076C0453|nr:YfhO family protein [Flavobacterium sp. TAB 87]KVV15562.1 putative membrane protein [Flavobacterium sp. TAB 87]
MKIVNKFYPHALVIVGFVLVSLIYFYPVLQGKQIFQSDIAQYVGMAKEQNDFRAQEHTEPYWTNSAFGGMPTYQLGAKYPHDYIGHLDDALRFLPRPADYLFLYFLGFYGLLLVLKVDPLKGFIGALAFGFSTYLIIILGVGHNAKAHAIAYMPLVVAGCIMVYQRRFIVGGLLTMFAAALEINANHFQMTYYLLIFLIVLSIYFIYGRIKEKDLKSLGFAFGTFAIAAVFAIGSNATNLMATSEYAAFSTRGKGELKINPDGSRITENSALSRDYITEYSYGITESLNLIAPRIFGGSNHENVGTDSKMYEFMVQQGVPSNQAQDFVSGVPSYWGDQPIVAAPAYIGVVVFFLAVLALFLDDRKIKYVFLSGAVISLLLSWGKNFAFLTDFFIDFVPMYDKFRAVSSIQVLLELCVPVLAIMGLQSFFNFKEINSKKAQKGLLETAAVSFGILLILLVSKSMFNFAGASDGYYLQSYGPGFVDALKEDRKTMYSADLLRSGFFILVVFAAFWFFLKGKLSQKTTLIIVSIFMIFDLFFVDKKYVSAKDFVSAREIENPFQETQSDVQILQDPSHYRVFEVNGNFSSARASFFHKSIGGYHAAKPRKMQQLFDYQIAQNNMEVLDMLNVKYIIQTDKEGKEFPTVNPDANGNAWFVESIKIVTSPDDEMQQLRNIDTKTIAVFNVQDYGAKFTDARLRKKWDTRGTITLQDYKPNYLKYQSDNLNDGIAVFSEIYYENGWNAYVDGTLTEHFPVDYVLRAMEVPGGKHTIEFKFEPQVIKTGGTIALISSIGMLLLLVGGIYWNRKKGLKS